jgi:uncharacterized protein (DUF983 family)
MAWFDPPLHKPGNKKCPSCGNSVRRESMGYLWSTRYCTQCGAALRHDLARFFMGLVLIAPLVAVWVWCIWDETVWPLWARCLSFVVYLLALGLNWWWFPSISLREKAPSKPRSS